MGGNTKHPLRIKYFIPLDANQKKERENGSNKGAGFPTLMEDLVPNPLFMLEYEG